MGRAAEVSYLFGAVAGYVVGSTPTAWIVGRAFGADLRASGTGNPGTANAIGVLGKGPGLVLLLFDFAKGAIAVLIARAVAGDGAGLVAVVAAMLGQILNPWFGFKGGKGLGTGGGAVLVAFPPGLVLMAPVISGAGWLLRSAAKGALVALAGFIAVSALWAATGWTTWWGVTATWALVACATGVALAAGPKFLRDARRGVSDL